MSTPLEPSNLLQVAERAVVAFQSMVANSTGDQLQAAQALLELAKAMNELGEEINKSKATLAQFESLKEKIFGSLNTESSQNPQDALAQILSQVLPKKENI